MGIPVDVSTRPLPSQNHVLVDRQERFRLPTLCTMKSHSHVAKFCTNNSYYGVPINFVVIQRKDPLCPDGPAQAIAAWSYVAFVTLIVILCCVSPCFRRVRTLISSTGSDVFMVTFLIFIVLGYSSTPDIALFWISSCIVTIVSGIAFLIYGNFKFFMNLPTVDSVWEQVTSAPEIRSISEQLPSVDSSSRNADMDDTIVRQGDEGKDQERADLYRPSCNVNPIGAKYHKIQFVIGFLTFLTVTIEMIFMVALASSMPCQSCTMEITSSVTLMIQKVAQAVVYASISRKLAKSELICETIYYLNIIGLINFAMWLDSLAYSQYSEALEASRKSYREPFEILEVLYEALVADYRLLCSALFIEHAQDLKEEFSGSHAPLGLEEPLGNRNDEVTVPVIMFSVDEEHYRYLGFGAGFAVIAVEILKNLRHVARLQLPPAFGMFGALTQLIIVSCVTLFIYKNPKEKKAEKSAVRFLVACMGSIGLCYFLFRFLLNLHWIGGSYSAIKEDATWDAVNCGGKCLSLFFLLMLFLHTEDESVSKNYHSKINQFLLPFLTVSIFGMFLGSLVEFHESKLDKTVICRTHSTSLATLFTAAPPLYLGFLMHTFAKVYMVSKHAKKRNIRVRTSSNKALLEERLLP